MRVQQLIEDDLNVDLWNPISNYLKKSCGTLSCTTLGEY